MKKTCNTKIKEKIFTVKTIKKSKPVNDIGKKVTI